jgi:RNA-directed DNA polymerase
MALYHKGSYKPFLSNLIFIDADAMISDYCIQRKIRYTRYADDLSFSGDFDEKNSSSS